MIRERKRWQGTCIYSQEQTGDVFIDKREVHTVTRPFWDLAAKAILTDGATRTLVRCGKA